MVSRLTLVVITLLSIASFSSAQFNIGGGVLGGVLSCTNTSISTAGTYRVIPNARVDFVCGNGSLSQVVRSVLTSPSGVYSFLFSTADIIANDPARCFLNVTVPPGSCIFSVPNGILRIPIVPLTRLDLFIAQVVVYVAGTLSYVLGGT